MRVGKIRGVGPFMDGKKQELELDRTFLRGLVVEVDMWGWSRLELVCGRDDGHMGSRIEQGKVPKHLSVDRCLK